MNIRAQVSQEKEGSPIQTEAGLESVGHQNGVTSEDPQIHVEAQTSDPQTAEAEKEDVRIPSPAQATTHEEEKGTKIQQQTSFLRLAYSKFWAVGP